MMISLLFNSIMLWPLHTNLFSHLSIYHLTFIQLQAAHLIFVVINCIIASFLRNRRSIEYIGQVNMLALIAILLLLPIMIINNFIAMNLFIIVTYLFFLTVFIIKEYFRRMKYANIFLRTVIATNLICLAAFLGYVFH
jgi:hypothetical protein